MRNPLFVILICQALGCASSQPPHVSRPGPCRSETSSVGQPPRTTAIEALGDTWVGGFGPLDGVGSFVRVDFSTGTIRVHPREGRAPLGIVRPWVDRDGAGREIVHFTAYEGTHLWSFELRRSGTDELDGTVSDPKAGSSSIKLVHAESPDREAVDAVFAGTYAIDGDPGRLVLIEGGRLFDTRNGTERRLFLLPGGRALVGSGVGTAHPPAGIARLDDRTLRIDGATAFAASRFAVRKDEVQFTSDGVTLQGTFISPPGPGPFPTAVFVHGSGHSSRKDPWENAMARVLASAGYAMFLYEKRGVGDSGGEYVGPGGRETNNVSKENLERLARDARAALVAIGARQDVDPNWTGFLGLSQAGWIVPQAALRNERVRFVIMISSPTVPTAVQLAYQTLNGDAISCLSLSEAARVTRDHAPRTGVDPAQAIAALNVPGLWIYGSSDPLIPFAESISVLERMKKRGFTVRLAPNAGHELNVVTHDTEDERQLSPGMSPMAIDTLHTWLRTHAPGRASQ